MTNHPYLASPRFSKIFRKYLETSCPTHFHIWSIVRMFFNTVCASYVEISLDTAMGQKIAHISFTHASTAITTETINQFTCIIQKKKNWTYLVYRCICSDELDCYIVWHSTSSCRWWATAVHSGSIYISLDVWSKIKKIRLKLNAIILL